jgi:DNA invertase Pin-like site-specific DNA recombinase
MYIVSMARAVLYVRVSTTEQALEGVSLEAQEARLRAYCAMRDLEIVEVVTDAGVSAGKALHTRDGGARVVELVRAKAVEAVVAYKLDRLFRDCADCLTVTRDWDRRSIALHLVDLGGQTIDTSSAMGRFFLTVIAGAAELERGMVGERTAAAMAHKRAKHEYCGGEAPYGYVRAADGVNLVPCPSEQVILSAARDLRDEGRSLRAVGAELARRGLLPRGGGRWHAATVRRLLEAA